MSPRLSLCLVGSPGESKERPGGGEAAPHPVLAPRYSAHAQALDHRCSCCKEERTSEREVVLDCPNGGTLAHTYTHIESCLCQDSVCGLPLAPQSRVRRSSPRLLGRA